MRQVNSSTLPIPEDFAERDQNNNYQKAKSTRTGRGHPHKFGVDILLYHAPNTPTNHSPQHHQHPPPSPFRSRPPPIPPFAPDRAPGPDSPLRAATNRLAPSPCSRAHHPGGPSLRVARVGCNPDRAHLGEQDEGGAIPSRLCSGSAMGKCLVVVAIGPEPPTAHHEGGATIGAL